MINLANRAGVLTLILLFVFQSCSSNNDSTDTPVVVTPDKISVQVDVVGKTAEMPNGDGSGKINLKIDFYGLSIFPTTNLIIIYSAYHF